MVKTLFFMPFSRKLLEYSYKWPAQLRKIGTENWLTWHSVWKAVSSAAIGSGKCGKDYVYILATPWALTRYKAAGLWKVARRNGRGTVNFITRPGFHSN